MVQLAAKVDHFFAATDMECGKILAVVGERDEAAKCWGRGLLALEGDEKQLVHYARMLANLASLKLSSGDSA